MERAATKPKDERSRLLSRVHIAKKALGLDEDTYRAMLGGMGVASAGDLALPQLRQVAAALDRDARRVQTRRSVPAREDRNPYGDTPRNLNVPDRAAQLGKIGALLTDMSLPWSYADGISKQMFGVQKAEWLNESGQRTAIITALVREANRRHKWFQGERERLMVRCRDVLWRGLSTLEVLQRGRDFQSYPFHRICPGGPKGQCIGAGPEAGFLRVDYRAEELLAWCENYVYADPASVKSGE